MKLEQSFEVMAAVETVWKTLIDVERVAPCLPGAEITEAKEDGSYEGNFKVKLGPTTAAYTGRLSLEDLDESSRRATMKATGRDRRGQGSANATIVSTMHQAGDGTRVEVETDFTITGRLARFGRGGMIQDISNRLLRDFAGCLQQTLEGGGGAAPPAPAAESAVPREPEEAGAPDPERPSSTADRPPTASPGPAPADMGAADAPPGPAAGPGTGPAAPSTGAAERAGAGAPAGAKPATSAHPRPPAQPAKPVRGISLLLSVLVERVRRLLARLRS